MDKVQCIIHIPIATMNLYKNLFYCLVFTEILPFYCIRTDSFIETLPKKFKVTLNFVLHQLT